MKRGNEETDHYAYLKLLVYMLGTRDALDTF